MKFTYEEALRLENYLRAFCPFDTHTLQNLGITSVQIVGDGAYQIIIGNDETYQSGLNPSEYVFFTEETNKSKGWIDAAIIAWANDVTKTKKG